MRDAATICMARVICAVLRTPLMRRRISRRLGNRFTLAVSEGLDSRSEAAGGLIRNLLFGFDGGQHVRVAALEVGHEAILPGSDFIDGYFIELAVGHGPDDGHL